MNRLLMMGQKKPYCRYGEELISNGGFETVGAGGVDVFANWTEAAGSGTITRDTSIFHSGVASCKLVTGTTGGSSYISTPQITVIPGETYSFLFWLRGDGTNTIKYSIYDNSHSSFLFNGISSAIVSAVWTPKIINVTIPAGCVKLQLYFLSPTANNSYGYIDDVSMRRIVAPKYFYDTFQQEDGDLLYSKSNWPYELQVNGSNSNCLRKNRRMDISDTGTGLAYAYVNFPSKPVYMSCKAIWKNDAAGRGSSIAMVSSITYSRQWTDLLHFVVDTTGWQLQIRAGSSWSTLATGALSLSHSVEYFFGMSINNDTVTLTIPTIDQQIITDARIATYNGRYVYYELTRGDASYKTPTFTYIYGKW